MKEFLVSPKIVELESVMEFIDRFDIKDNDLIITNHHLYDDYFKKFDKKAKYIYYGDYANGEPTDILVDNIYNDIKDYKYGRVIGIGGGAIIDVAKLFALENISPVVDLFEKKIEAKKSHELLIIPTTCGTGSEVTNISILALTTRNTKFGLADKALYADYAILIPELLDGLPYKAFATSSIDALIHAVESFTSPKANSFTKMYSKEAIGMILSSYKKIRDFGKDVIKGEYPTLLLASTYAGIAFSNAGCAAVHAMSYPLGAKYHVAHGESNYVLFTEVYKMYMKIDPNGSIKELNDILAIILECDAKSVYDYLDKLLESILEKKQMAKYGVTYEDLEEFTKSVMERQGRLMQNNYKELDSKKVRKIYERVF